MYNKILQVDNFRLKLVSMDKEKKVVLKLNSNNLQGMAQSLQVS